MDKEFLQDYEENEIYENKKYNSIIDRLGKLKQPVFNLISPCQSFWSQVPFSGTIIFPLRPLPKDIFLKSLNISENEIPDLIQLAKDTKKIQFLLCDFPSNFLEFDYLEPFFKEMTPPVYSLQNDIQRDALMNQFHTAEIEITTIIELSPEFQFLKYSSSGDHIISDYIRQYAWLRHLGFNEIADTFIDNLLINPGFSTYFLETAYNLLVHPIIDPFHANPSFSMQDLAKMNEIGFDVQISGKKNYLPEVGSFLLKKTTYYPESLDACKNIIARYDENDLYEVYSALNTSISSRNPEGILKNKSEVALILDNVWSDTELIESNVSAYKFGIGVTCGVVGMSIGGLAGGLLGSIGISALNQTKSSYLDQFSELIAKSVASPYLTTIYDFKKKYHIPE